MIAPPEGERLPPRALIVPLIAIAKLELLTRPPRGMRALLGLRGLPAERRA
jgi:hypothetical protein